MTFRECFCDENHNTTIAHTNSDTFLGGRADGFTVEKQLLSLETTAPIRPISM